MSEMKRDVKLSPAGLAQAEYGRTTWAITSAFGVSKSDIEDPAYWAHVAAKMRPRDKIEVLAEDGSFYAEYLVTSCDKTWAKVAEIKFMDLTKVAVVTNEQAEIINAGYDVTWGGPKKWRVIRKSDRATLVEGLHSKDDGHKWLTVHLSSQGIAA